MMFPLHVCRDAAFTLMLLLLVPLARGGPWNVRDHVAQDKIPVQSHRGAGVLMPENSVEAFALAWKLGTIPEADLRTTRDGVIVTFHDKDFRRILPNAPVAAKRRGIQDLTWEEVRKLDIGAWKGKPFSGQRVSRMLDVYPLLAARPDRRMYIDIKNVDLAQLAREAHAVADRLILASTDYAVIRHWKELAPESATLHWMGGTEAELATRFKALRATRFADITQLQIHVHTQGTGPARTLTPSPEFLRAAGEELRARGIVFQVLPWESKDPNLFWRLMDLGVASFATDYPDVMMNAIRDYYAQPRGK